MPDLDAVSQELAEIVERTYEAGSADGRVVVVAGGDQRLRSVTITGTDHTLPRLTQDLNAAIKDGITRAQRQTVAAMSSVQGLDPSLRQALQEGRR